MIHGLSDQRRLPRLGKIKLGVMRQSSSGVSYPSKTDYFVCPEPVRKLYGDQPRELPVQFPVDEPATLFPQEYKMYRDSGLICRGDGAKATRWNDKGDLVELSCPCDFLESGECGPVGTLNFLMPDVPGIGIWQLTTGSRRSIVSINSSLETMSRAFGGLVGVPFTLRLVPEQSQRWDEAKQKMVKLMLYTVTIDSPATFRDIWEWRKRIGAPVTALMPATLPDVLPSLPAPVDEAQTVIPGGDDAARQEHTREALMTMFHEAAGGDAAKALLLLRRTAKANLRRSIDGLADLSDDEVATLTAIMARS